jgi:phosphoglycerate dehydrogenase-like enzyme
VRRREAGRDEWAEVLSGPDALPRLLGASDYLVLTAPATAQTRGIIDEQALRAMKASAVLVNVSRGSLVDELALARALHEGRLRGAALDVFTHEPLPAEHPLRDAPRTLLSPHISAYSWRFWEREGELIARNLQRYLAGEPLLNVVDPAAGY